MLALSTTANLLQACWIMDSCVELVANFPGGLTKVFHAMLPLPQLSWPEPVQQLHDLIPSTTDVLRKPYPRTPTSLTGST